MIKQTVHRKLLVSVFVLGAYFILPRSVFAQNYSSKKEIKDELQLAEKLWEESSDNEEKSISELFLISAQIGLQEQYLDKLKQDIEKQNREIEELNQLIQQMEIDIQKIMDEYARTAQTTYKKFDTDNFWLSLLSSGSISEAYYRAVYFKQFSKYRQKQVTLIKRTQKFLANKSAELQQSVHEKELLIAEHQEEEKKISQSKKVQKKLISELKPKEAAIRKKNNNKKAEIKKKIQTAEKKKAQPNVIKTSTKPISSANYASAFPKSKGKLSWPIPINSGLIIEHFGKSEDPYGNQINNDGIYIRTTKGQSVSAVFTGTVTGFQKLPMNGGEVVIIEHGNYRTVYANLESSVVNEGQLIKQGEVIGKVKTNKRTGETLLNFLIYKYPDQFDDPEKWIIQK